MYVADICVLVLPADWQHVRALQVPGCVWRVLRVRHRFVLCCCCVLFVRFDEQRALRFCCTDD